MPVYNRAVVMKRFIDSVLSQSHQDFELLIVDDGSKDDSFNIATKYAKMDKRIRCYRHETRQGPAAARNTAIKASKGNLIFIGEDDVTLLPNCIEILVETFGMLQGKYKVGAVGPKLVETGIIATALGAKNRNIVEISKLTGDIRKNWAFGISRVTEVPTLHACSLINREVFSEVGGYDNKLYKGNFLRDETDLYYRAGRAGFRFFLQPKAIAYHLFTPRGGCRKSPVMAEYYSIRNHTLFLARFYRLNALYMTASFAAKRVLFHILSTHEISEAKRMEKM